MGSLVQDVRYGLHPQWHSRKAAQDLGRIGEIALTRESCSSLATRSKLHSDPVQAVGKSLPAAIVTFGDFSQSRAGLVLVGQVETAHVE